MEEALQYFQVYVNKGEALLGDVLGGSMSATSGTQQDTITLGLLVFLVYITLRLFMSFAVPVLFRYGGFLGRILGGAALALFFSAVVMLFVLIMIR